MSKQHTPKEEEFELLAQIERRREQPNLCTIYQSSADEMTKMSRWITAKEGSFLDPRSFR